jgi:uncharacterized protein involved in outer membrane biogenesis
LVVLGLLAIGMGHGALPRLVVAALNRSLEGHLDFDGARIFPNGSVELRGVRIAGPGDDLILSAARLDARVDLLPLLRRRVVVRGLRLTGARLRIESLADGGLNVARAFEPRRPATVVRAGPASPWTVSIQAATLSIDRFDYLAPGAAAPLVTLEHVDLEATLLASGRRLVRHGGR